MLLEKIEADLKDGMRARDTIKTDTLRGIKSALNYLKIEKQVEEVTDDDILTILNRQIKQRKESIESYKTGGRTELAEKEAKELVILEGYLPKQASPEEVKKIIMDAIAETAAAGKKDFGKVMKIVTPKLKGQADGKVISQIVGEELAKKEQPQ
jgi:uncharacterized protein YqeY